MVDVKPGMKFKSMTVIEESKKEQNSNKRKKRKRVIIDYQI
jgi:hypothetical protein